MDLVHTSAVVIIPPEKEWDPIQQIRRKHDKAYKRWMPHINLLYPFVSEAKFEEVVPLLQEAAQTQQAFRVQFNGFGHFEHKSQHCVWLKPQPAEPISELQAALQNAFPDCVDQTKHGEFTPHLTVGQFPNPRGKPFKLEETTAPWKWQPFEFTVSHVYVIARTQFGPFKIKHAIPLKPNPDLISNEEDELSQRAGDAAEAAEQEGTAEHDNAPPTITAEENRLQERAGQPTTDPTEKVLRRVRRWLINSPNRRTLPRTKEKLRAAIFPMCQVQRRVDPEQVFKILLDKGHIALEGDKLKYAQDIRAPSTTQLAQTSWTSSYYASGEAALKHGFHHSGTHATEGNDEERDAQRAVARAELWLSQTAPADRPKTVAAFKKSLAQLCCSKVHVDVATVVKLLEEKHHYFHEKEDFTLEYSLP